MADVNLIPPQRRQQKQRQHKWRLWSSVVGAYIVTLTLVLGSAYAIWADDDEVLDKKLHNTEQRIKQHQSSIVKLRTQLALCRNQLQANRTILDQPDWSRLLHLVAESVGDDVVLQQCQLSTLDKAQNNIVDMVRHPGAAPATDTILQDRNYQFRLTGFARTQTAVSLFVLRLERLDLFVIVRLDKSRREPFLEGPAISFTIECQL